LQGNGDIPTERIGLREEIIAPVLSEMQEALRWKKIKVSCNQDLSVEGDAFVIGNRLMLKSVFRALFSNAIKHGYEDSVLSYGISSNGRRYKIHVTNEGDSVPAELQASIFDEFVQVKTDESVSIREKGLGLGLALAKDILRQHGGDIWYESQANGSKFVCTMPHCPAQTKG
jgi:two-component system heavy metal sensor histidine kinase CusS